MIFKCDGCTNSCYIAFATCGEAPCKCVNTGENVEWHPDSRVVMTLRLKGVRENDE